MGQLIRRVGEYLSLVKFSHTIFAMPFALLGFFTAVADGNSSFSLKLFLLVILCMVFARNAAMAFNRFTDKHIDSLNPRTAIREIPKGKISPKSALIFVIVNSILFIIAAGFINKLSLFLSPVALIVVLGYSVTKRFTALSHLVLGLGLSLAPVGAYISVAGSFNLIPILYGMIVLTWVGGFDIIYSLQDITFDISNKLFSIPAKTGVKMAIVISSLLHTFSIAVVTATGIINDSGIFYWSGAVAFSALLVWEHILIKPGDTNRINMAFGTINSLAGVVYSLLTIADLYITL
ncbi:MAG TPA: UbiA-like polyprenyltransferase [Bacteroidales bacterium]|nr:UbiA-like polyprenyltransferase [Bacteroidales bacterium]